MNSIYVAVSKLSSNSIDELINFERFSSEILLHVKNLSQKKTHEFLLGRALLSELIHLIYQKNILPKIEINQNSRPFFFDKNLPFFNISHSKNWVAVAISAQGNIGIDLEQTRIKPNFLKVAQKRFSENEIKQLNHEKNPELLFWKLWTLKESALKFASKGVWQMKEIEIIENLFKAKNWNLNIYPFYFYQKNHFHLAISHEFPVFNINLFEIDNIRTNHLQLNIQKRIQNELIPI